MHKNYTLFYCYLPKFAEERLFIENTELGLSPMALYDCLYQNGASIGRIFRNAQECAKAMLSGSEQSNYATAPATSIYNDFNERTFERDSLGRLVEPQFQLVHKYIATADDLSDEVGIIDHFLGKYMDGKELCTEEKLIEFSCSIGSSLPNARSFAVDLEEYLTSTNCVHTRQETLDMVLKYYSFTDTARDSIRKCVEPYIYEPDDFLKSLKQCLSKHISATNQYVTFHLYEIESLFDLFSATMQEATRAKRFAINHCRYCTKWFITNKRINESYCGSECEENWKQLNSKHRSVYKSIYNYLSEYCTNEKLNEFMCNHAARKDKVYYASDLRELIAWLNDFRDNIKAQNHTE